MNAKPFPRWLVWLGALTLAGAAAAPAVSQEIPRFDIRVFRVEGNKLLSRQTVDAALAPFVGKQKDFGDVQGALEALEQVYKDRGYTTVSVLLPEQTLEGGEVLLQVVEGRIRSVKVDGQAFFDHANIRASLPALKEGEVPIMDDLSASLRVANEHPMKKLTVSLSPGDKEDDLDAIVAVIDEKPWRAAATLDNTGTTQTGEHRLGLTWQHGNLFNRDHQLSLQYQTSPEKLGDLKVYAASYRIPLYALGDSIDLFTTYSDVNVGTILAGTLPLAVTGKGSTFGGRYNWNLKRRGDYEHQMVFGLDEKAFKNSVIAEEQQLGNDVTLRPLSVAYNGRWMLQGSETGFYVSLARNLPGGKNADQDAVSKARENASAAFQVLRGGVNMSRAFAADWQWRVNVTGQWTNSPLVPGEQFGVGGSASVRGFEERQLSNDIGYQGNLEVYTPELCASVGASCRMLGFYDFGALRRNQPLPGESASNHVGSAGVGVRYALGKRLTFQADYAQVLDPGTNLNRGAWKLHARIGFSF
jgi:hemolysin activation/secretion protein